MISTRAGGISYPLVFDRPFLIAIVDEESEDVLLLGAVSSPHGGACRAILERLLRMRN